MTRGNYSTKQKEELLDIIKHIHREFTVKDVFKMSPSTSLTTIYRFIDKLEEDGVIQKSIGNDGKNIYQYIEKCDCSHFYLKCDCCGRLTHVECEFVNDLSNHIINNHQFHLNKEHIIISGLCKECYKKEGK